MSLPLKPEHLTQLKVFVELCMVNPAILHHPELAFVKSFIEHFGGSVGTAKDDGSSSKAAGSTDKSKAAEPEAEPESEESDLELDMEGVIEPDTDAPQKMGNLTLQPTEEEIAESQAKRSEAVSAFAEKDYEKAIELYTEAIVLNPQASLLYAKRGQVFLLLNRPNACIRDCNRALELNPDSAAAHKFRGRAFQLLGKFEEAATDLRLACKFDFDEQADEWLREVTPNARKIEEHKRKKERKVKEKLEREKQEKLKKAWESAKAYEENTRTSQTDTSRDTAGTSDFYKFLNDPEVLRGFQDPEINAAFKEISMNPTNILKYQGNPKIMEFINKITSTFGWGSCPGMGGGIPGFPSGAAKPESKPAPPKPQPQVDDDLD
ncbi:putative protein FAM10A4 [Hylaeus anthracinus]|uniref:putative protein FAM10A4 n=1 Tax=Hylaeus anthracinus TaxID=313031 RepID=UPI0023B88B97|nr:putative protein FAM10A4 [Hylaeus anthracinus]